MSLDLPAQEPDLEQTVLAAETASPWPPSGAIKTATEIDVQPRIEPVSAAERFFAVDVLRGFAPAGHPGDEHRRLRLADDRL